MGEFWLDAPDSMKVALFLIHIFFSLVYPHPSYVPPYGERLQPKPFVYEYGVQDSRHGGAFTKKETQDNQGNVFGSVVVNLPDGRIQTTNYNADFYDGYNADVRYAGTAQYPSEYEKTNNGQTFINSDSNQMKQCRWSLSQWKWLF